MNTLRVVIHHSEPRREWCPECNTSGVAACDVLHLGERGVTTVGTYRNCSTCGEAR